MSIDYAEAMSIITDITPCTPVITVDWQHALNKICANTIYSKKQLPFFNNSAMDGFAVKSISTTQASPTKPTRLEVQGSIAAGDIPTIDDSIQTNSFCTEIMTGAMVPEIYDAVIPIEKANLTTKGTRRQINIIQPVSTQENIRLAGEDYSYGDCVIQRGDTITSRHIMALTSLGINKIDIHAPPKIAILCTGKELLNSKSDVLTAANIYNSNGPYLLSLLPSLGTEVSHYSTISDDINEFENVYHHLQQTEAPDIIISTGAVSKGKWDFIPKALNKLGAKTLFHRVNIRPGKPILFAKFNGGPYFIGLPGNPIAVAAGLRFFIYPLLCQFRRLDFEQPLKAQLTHQYDKKNVLRHFLKSYVSINEQGKVQVKLLNGQESFKINPFVKANAWVALPEEKTKYDSGNLLDIYPFFNTPLNNSREPND